MFRTDVNQVADPYYTKLPIWLIHRRFVILAHGRDTTIN